MSYAKAVFGRLNFHKNIFEMLVIFHTSKRDILGLLQHSDCSIIGK